MTISRHGKHHMMKKSRHGSALKMTISRYGKHHMMKKSRHGSARKMTISRHGKHHMMTIGRHDIPLATPEAEALVPNSPSLPEISNCTWKNFPDAY